MPQQYWINYAIRYYHSFILLPISVTIRIIFLVVNILINNMKQQIILLHICNYSAGFTVHVKLAVYRRFFVTLNVTLSMNKMRKLRGNNYLKRIDNVFFVKHHLYICEKKGEITRKLKATLLWKDDCRNENPDQSKRINFTCFIHIVFSFRSGIFLA